MSFFYDYYPRRGLPSCPVSDDDDDDYGAMDDRLHMRALSKPLLQFRNQSRRERQRLEHQRYKDCVGRRQTLPWDDTLDFQKNAENNVRSRWVKQGIWGEEWGPAWTKESLKREPGPVPFIMRDYDGPFSGAFGVSSRAMPGARWGHEDGPEPEPDPVPKPQPERPPGAFLRPQPEPEKPEPLRPRKTIRLKGGRSIIVETPRPTVRDPEASRPHNQFRYQVSQERPWVKDEATYTTPGQLPNVEALAYESVKSNWIADGIWHPSWVDWPGSSWLHEEPDPNLPRYILPNQEDDQTPESSDHEDEQRRLESVHGGEPRPDSSEGGRQTFNVFTPARAVPLSDSDTGTESVENEGHSQSSSRASSPTIIIPSTSLFGEYRSQKTKRARKHDNADNAIEGPQRPAKRPKYTNGGLAKPAHKEFSLAEEASAGRSKQLRIYRGIGTTKRTKGKEPRAGSKKYTHILTKSGWRRRANTAQREQQRAAETAEKPCSNKDSSTKAAADKNPRPKRGAKKAAGETRNGKSRIAVGGKGAGQQSQRNMRQEPKTVEGEESQVSRTRTHLNIIRDVVDFLLDL